MSIKLFPVGYVASSNATSKGSWSEGGTAKNEMFEPNDGATKSRRSYTVVSNMEDRTIWTRKIAERKHVFTYKYDNIWNHEYKLIKRFINDIADGRANSFKIVDWSSGVKVTALASSAGDYNASIYDTTDFTTVGGEGGHYVCLWNGRTKKFRIGAISSLSEDSSVTFPDSTDYGDLDSLTENEVFAYPVYNVYLTDDNTDLTVSGFVGAGLPASFCGPVRSGNINFIQKGTK